MKKLMAIFFVAGLALLGCSDDDDKKEMSGDHVWKGQTEVLEKAKEVTEEAEELLEEQKKKMKEMAE